MKTIALSEAKEGLAKLLRIAEDEEVVITRHGKPAGVLRAFALMGLAADKAFGALIGDEKNPLAPRTPHFTPRARNVIFLYMDGGPSQVDTFDPKPRLDREHGKPFAMKMEPTQFNNNGTTF